MPVEMRTPNFHVRPHHDRVAPNGELARPDLAVNDNMAFFGLVQALHFARPVTYALFRTCDVHKQIIKLMPFVISFRPAFKVCQMSLIAKPVAAAPGSGSFGFS